MWFVQPKEDYVSKVPWKHLDKPAVMSWQIRVRDYNTFVANTLFAILMAIFSVASVGFGFAWGFESIFLSLLMAGGPILFILSITMSMTHQTTIIVYRFTENIAEVYSWKPQIDSAKPVLKWMSIILLPIVGVIILMDPGLVATAIGPLGMGLMAWMMGSSEKYQTWQRDSRHIEYEWREAEEMVVWHKRRLIGLRFTYPSRDGGEYSTYSKVYCHENNLDEAIDFFRSKLPDVPYNERELKVYANFAL